MNKKSLLKCAVIGLVATLGLAACGTSKDASGGSSSGKEVLESVSYTHLTLPTILRV